MISTGNGEKISHKQKNNPKLIFCNKLFNLIQHDAMHPLPKLACPMRFPFIAYLAQQIDSCHKICYGAACHCHSIFRPASGTLAGKEYCTTATQHRDHTSQKPKAKVHECIKPIMVILNHFSPLAPAGHEIQINCQHPCTQLFRRLSVYFSLLSREPFFSSSFCCGPNQSHYATPQMAIS